MLRFSFTEPAMQARSYRLGSTFLRVWPTLSPDTSVLRDDYTPLFWSSPCARHQSSSSTMFHQVSISFSTSASASLSNSYRICADISQPSPNSSSISYVSERLYEMFEKADARTMTFLPMSTPDQTKKLHEAISEKENSNADKDDSKQLTHRILLASRPASS